jgi:hypothetical protein
MSSYDYEIDTKADKNEIANNFFEIRQLITKSLDDFIMMQKSKLEEFCTDLENDESYIGVENI